MQLIDNWVKSNGLNLNLKKARVKSPPKAHLEIARIVLKASAFGEITSNLFWSDPGNETQLLNYFRAILVKINMPKYDIPYFASESILVSAALKIKARDLVEKNPRSILVGVGPF